MENKYVLLNSEGIAIGEAPTMQACRNYRSHLMLEALIDGETFELCERIKNFKIIKKGEGLK